MEDEQFNQRQDEDPPIADINTTRCATPPPNSVCRSCTKRIDKLVFKCNNCKQLYHPNCTHLPTYTIVTYFTTKVQFTCESCVKARHSNYDALVSWIGLNDHTAQNTNNQVNEPTINDVIDEVRKLKHQVNQLSTERGKPVDSYATKVTTSKSPKYDVIVKSNKGANADKHTVANALQTVPVVKMTTMRSGDIRLTLPDAQTAKAAVTRITSETSNSHTASTVTKLRPKLTITGVELSIPDEQLLDEIKNKNQVISSLMNNEGMKILFSYNSPRHQHTKTVIVSATAAVRNAIMTTGRLYIGFARCNVYDRYWVNRCRKCLSLSHKTSSCDKTKHACGYCAGQHKTNDDCEREQHTCFNCLHAGRADTAHSAFATTCPCFIAVRNSVIERTERTEDETKNGISKINTSAASSTGAIPKNQSGSQDNIGNKLVR